MDTKKIVLLYFVLFGGTLYMHEKAHQEIQQNFGCLDSRIGIEPTRLYTKCYAYEERTEYEMIEEKKLHSINEIVGYNIESILIAMFLLHYSRREEEK